jgi:hypothetical protein
MLSLAYPSRVCLWALRRSDDGSGRTTGPAIDLLPDDFHEDSIRQFAFEQVNDAVLHETI